MCSNQNQVTNSLYCIFYDILFVESEKKNTARLNLMFTTPFQTVKTTSAKDIHIYHVYIDLKTIQSFFTIFDKQKTKTKLLIIFIGIQLVINAEFKQSIAI